MAKNKLRIKWQRYCVVFRLISYEFYFLIEGLYKRRIDILLRRGETGQPPGVGGAFAGKAK